MVLQRQQNGTLHYHGIAHMPWLDDDLVRWRRLIVKSGFGVQNRLVVARREHAGYCAKYISTRMATLAPLRRAYGFSRAFPRTTHDELARVLRIGPQRAGDKNEHVDSQELEARAAACGVEEEDFCSWVPASELRL